MCRCSAKISKKWIMPHKPDVGKQNIMTYFDIPRYLFRHDYCIKYEIINVYKILFYLVFAGKDGMIRVI